MAYLALYDDTEAKTKEIELQGSGEIEFQFNDRASADITVDWSNQSVVIKPSAKASIRVFSRGNLKIPGGTSLDILERDIGTHAAVSLSFPSKMKFGITYKYRENGNQFGFSIGIKI
jgi:hypothetical protein